MQPHELRSQIGSIDDLKRIFASYLSSLVAATGKDVDWGPLASAYSAVCATLHGSLHKKAKGFCLYGPVGSGKTTATRAAMATVAEIIKRDPLVSIQGPPAINISARALNAQFSQSSTEEEYIEWLQRHRHICIDDLGREEPFDKFAKLYHFTRIAQIADYLGPAAPVIHCSTNMNRAQTMEMYGEHVLDRMSTLFTPIAFSTQKSLRQ